MEKQWRRRVLFGSRADRAERRTAAAIQDASVSLDTTPAAVRQAAVARVKADEACLSSCRAPSPRKCDRPSPDAPGTMQRAGDLLSPKTTPGPMTGCHAQ